MIIQNMIIKFQFACMMVHILINFAFILIIVLKKPFFRLFNLLDFLYLRLQHFINIQSKIQCSQIILG